MPANFSRNTGGLHGLLERSNRFPKSVPVVLYFFSRRREAEIPVGAVQSGAQGHFERGTARPGQLADTDHCAVFGRCVFYVKIEYCAPARVFTAELKIRLLAPGGYLTPFRS